MSDPAPLSGKRVLFIDDRFESTMFFMKRLERLGATIIHTDTIERAYQILEKMLSGTEDLDFVFLDLHMRIPEPLPDGLKEFESKFADFQTTDRRSLNAGQILGMYMNKHLSNVPFVYLSAVASNYEKIDGGESKWRYACFDKFDVTPGALANYVVTTLANSK